MFNTQVYEVEEYQRSNNLSELGSNSEFDGLFGGSTVRFLSESNELELITPENKTKRSSKHASAQADHRDLHCNLVTCNLISENAKTGKFC